MFQIETQTLFGLKNAYFFVHNIAKKLRFKSKRSFGKMKQTLKIAGVRT